MKNRYLCNVLSFSLTTLKRYFIIFIVNNTQMKELVLHCKQYCTLVIMAVPIPVLGPIPSIICDGIGIGHTYCITCVTDSDTIANN